MTATTGLDSATGISLGDPLGADQPGLGDGADLSLATAHVVAIVVAHDGQPWLDRALGALAAQGRSPNAVIAVDTGSVDRSPELLAQAAPDVLHLMPRSTGFGAAIQAGLSAYREQFPQQPPDWLWLLHDDCAPDQDALAQLLAVATKSAKVAVAGAKLVSWADPARLVEVGLTVARSGRRDTGLDGIERDQGQHDHRSDVLAVPSAGMLVRTEVWDDLGGFDRALPLLRDDIDFCWRVHLAGHRVVVVPQVRVADAQATSSGLRAAAALRGRGIARMDRQHALQIALTRAGWGFFLLAPWLVLVSLGRAAGALLAKRPRAAGVELLALVITLGTPWRWLAARWRHRGNRVVRRGRLSGLFTAKFATLRQLIEIIGGWAAGELPPAIGTAPQAELSSGQSARAGTWGRLLRHPMSWVLAAISGLTWWSWRGQLGAVLGPQVLGGGELQGSSSARELWAVVRDGIHSAGLGSDWPVSPGAGAHALLVTVGQSIGGSAAPGYAIDLFLVLAPLLAAISTYRACRVASSSRWVRAWASFAWAASPIFGSAVAQGRLGPLLAAVLWPLTAAAVVRALAKTTGQRATATATAILGVTTLLSVVPVFALPFLVVSALFVIFRRGVRWAAAALLIAPWLLLGPWVITLWAQPQRLLAGGGALADLAGRTAVNLDLGPLRTKDLSVPLAWRTLIPLHDWSAVAVLGGGLALVLIALVSLLRGGSRGRLVTGCAGLEVFAVAYTAVAPLWKLTGDGPGLTPWAGVGGLLVWAALIMAPVLAADALPGQLARHGFGWRHIAVAPIVLLAILGPVLAALAWSLHGPSLAAAKAAKLPAVAADAALEGTRTLVLNQHQGSWDYELLGSEPGPIARDLPPPNWSANSAQQRADRNLREAVTKLFAPGTTADPAGTLRQFAIGWVLIRQPVSTAQAERLDQVPEFTRVGRTAAGQLWRLGSADLEQSARVQLIEEGGSAQAVPVSGPHSRVESEVAASTKPRRLVLAEVASRHWEARFNGQPLTALAPESGWQQTFAVPPSAGELSIRSTSNWAWWQLGQLLFLAVVVLTALPIRRRITTTGGDSR